MKWRQHDLDRQPSKAVAWPRAVPTQELVLQMQRLAGNRAVESVVRGPSLALQRQLQVTGSPADVGTMLSILNRSSGLGLTHNRKTTQVTATGKPKKPKSPELARKLTEVIADPKRKAQINLGKTKLGVSFGAFPQSEDRPIQELRIDHFAALEKALPGEGAVILIHEITENFQASDPKLIGNDWRLMHELAHPAAAAEASLVLKELQNANGVMPSGDRLNDYVFVHGKGARQRFTQVQAHENDYLLYDSDPRSTTGAIINVRRAAKLNFGSFTVSGLKAGSDVIPTAANADLAKVTKKLTDFPSASVVLRGFPDKKSATSVTNWYVAIHKLITSSISDVILATDQRFEYAAAGSGTNTVEVVVNRPDIH